MGDQAPLKPERFLENKIKNNETLRRESGDMDRTIPEPRPWGMKQSTRNKGTNAEEK